jgi:LysM repeat protein
MTQLLVLVLLVCALVLPVLGAVALRVLAPRLPEGRLTLAAALIFGLAAASVLVLARGDVSRIQVAGLTVLLPVSAPAEGEVVLPPGLEGLTPVPDPTDDEHADHGEPTVEPTAEPVMTEAPAMEPTAEATATPEPTATAEPTAPPTATPAPPTATPEPPTPEPPTATPEPAGPRSYTVQPGDTLRSIAEQFGVSVADLLSANDLTPAEADSIRPGQELVVP